MDKLDAILGSEETLVPSSGFAGSVMRRVRDEAAAPPPIPFPWKRAIPGMVVAVVVLGWGAVELVRAGKIAFEADGLPQFQVPAWVPFNAQQACWLAIALGLALISWVGSRWLAGQSGLF